jgi:hypothetical protein
MRPLVKNGVAPHDADQQNPGQRNVRNVLWGSRRLPLDKESRSLHSVASVFATQHSPVWLFEYKQPESLASVDFGFCETTSYSAIVRIVVPEPALSWTVRLFRAPAHVLQEAPGHWRLTTKLEESLWKPERAHG